MNLCVFCSSVFFCEKKKTLESRGEIFLSQSAQSSLSLLAHISSPQNAFGIQRTQSVSAIVDTNKEAKSSLHPPNMGISVITPLPFGGGVGGGAAIFLAIVCSVILCSSVRNRTHPRKSKTLNISTVIVKIFQLPCPSLFIERLSLKQEEPLLRLRTRLSFPKKGVFYEQKGHVLKRYS